MIKCQAHYRVTIYSNENTVTITDPLTCHFNVTRGVMSDCNKATIQLYNLAPETREKIFQDAFTFEPEQWKYVHLEAGYGDRLSLIFKGRILQAYSRKSGGQTDIITEIQAQALDMFDCDSSYCFKAGTSKRDAFQTMALDMPNVKLANMGALEGVFQTDTTFDGNTMDCLNQLTGGNTFVDNGNLNCVMLNEVIDVPVPVITDDSCLLETPMRRDANLEIKMLFEPSLITAQLLEIKSGVAPNFNGQYKVLGFTHDCTISGSQGGTRITTANLYIGPMLPQPEVNATGVATGGAAPVSKVKGTTVVPLNSNLPVNIQEVYNYIQKYGQAPHTKITNNIYWHEVVKYPSLSYGKPTKSVLVNLYNVAYRLQVFHDKYYPGTKIQINSGWRSKGYNDTLGEWRIINDKKVWVRTSDPNSEHLYGTAIDFLITGQNLNVVYANLQKYWKGRKYKHKGNAFIHVDITTNRGVYANDW